MRIRALGITLVVGTCAFVGRAAAQDAEEMPAPSWNLSISGLVDGTYNYNFNQPVGNVTPYHSYDARAKTFDLNLAHVAFGASDEHLTFDLELDAGTDAVLNSGGSYFDVQEAWGAYKADSGIGIKAGKFVTTEGIEVIENNANPTVSRGFIFGLGEPTTLTGALGTYQINNEMDVQLGVVNGWDLVIDNNSMKTIMAKFGVTTDSFLLTLSALAGPEQVADNKDWRMNFDATGMYKLSQIDLWFQANSGMEQGLGMDGGAATWFGVGVQPVYHVDDKTTVGARVELFDDLDGARTGAEQMLVNISAAPAYALTDHFTMRAEVRADISNEKSFTNHDGDAKSLQLETLGEALVSF
jgi:hypothetical protein